MGRPRSRLRRRLRFGAAAVTVLLATTVSCVMLNLIAEKTGGRIDVTAMGEHHLSERTTSLIKRLGGPYEIVVGANWQSKDRRVADRVRDAVSRFDEASDLISTSLIDTGTGAGLDAYDDLLTRLAERESDTIQAQTATVQALAEELDGLATLFESLATSLDELGDKIPGANEASLYLHQRADAAPGAAKELHAYADAVREHAGAHIGPIALPRVEETKAMLTRELPGVDTQLSALSQNLAILAGGTGLSEEARLLAARLEREVRIRRDAWAISVEKVQRIQASDLSRVAKAMQAGEAAIVIGPDRVVGVDTTSLMPPGEWLDAERGVEADIGRRAEELLASALGALVEPARPIVVVVHARGEGFLERVPVMNVVQERLELHGVDFVEWPVIAMPDGPDLTTLDPDGSRPTVYIVISSDTSAGAPGEGAASGPEQAESLARVIGQIVEQGQPLMLSLMHSALPTYGMDDPMVRAIKPFGLEPDTSRPIMKERFNAGQRQIVTEHRIEAAENDHPLDAALTGLPTAFQWPVGINLTDPAPEDHVQRQVIYEITDSEAWGESQWGALWQWQAQQGGRGAAPPLPTPDDERDWTTGAWPICVAAERRPEGAIVSQRILVVGAFNWFFDAVTRQAMLIDERVVSQNPGNAELFDAAIMWLAGQDDLIARSPTARATSRIASIPPTRLSALRWALVGGLPGLALLLGALWWLLSK